MMPQDGHLYDLIYPSVITGFYTSAVIRIISAGVISPVHFLTALFIISFIPPISKSVKS